MLTQEVRRSVSRYPAAALQSLRAACGVDCGVDSGVECDVDRRQRSQQRLQSLRQATLALFTVAGLLTLSACTSLNLQGPDGNRGSAENVDSNALLADGAIRHETDSARVAQLWSAAEQARQEGDNEVARQRIIEAIEVSPQDGVLWSRAAELQLVLEEPALAESYAVKSNAYAATNRTLLLRNWLIIEHARELRGDLLGVRTAHQMVRRYQN